MNAGHVKPAPSAAAALRCALLSDAVFSLDGWMPGPGLGCRVVMPQCTWSVTQGNDYSAQLVGVRDMPRGPSRLSLDFSSLLGPLFMM